MILVLNNVSKGGGRALSLYAPKFNLLNLGSADERIVLRTVLRSASLHITVFANYVVGRKEAQIAIKQLQGLHEVNIVSVTRYGLGELASDVSRHFRKSGEMDFELEAHGEKIKIKIGDEEIPAVAEDMYASGGDVYLVVECANKKFRIVVGSNDTGIFDLQRRRIVGMEIRDGEIIFQRAFQHVG